MQYYYKILEENIAIILSAITLRLPTLGSSILTSGLLSFLCLLCLLCLLGLLVSPAAYFMYSCR